ncbi:hypothetical protein ACFV6F_20560 [Kitasatospora phosalacinea]|uniref:hypothetical protein n=1 Tax=Kitasatospora phosalacinea TaxID=2065 RepID=UPI00365F083C
MTDRTPPTPGERDLRVRVRAQQSGFSEVRLFARYGVDPVSAVGYGCPPGFGHTAEVIAEITATHHLLVLAACRVQAPPTLVERFAWRHAGPAARFWLSSCATDYGWPPTAVLPPPGEGGPGEAAAVRALEEVRRASTAALASGERVVLPVPLRPVRTAYALALAGAAELHALARREPPLPVDGEDHLAAGPWRRIEAVADTCTRLPVPADSPPGLRQALVAFGTRFATRNVRSAEGEEWLRAARSRRGR